jgi:hypothetical protein
MARNRFPTPQVVRLTLSENDWVEIKATLTVGEEKDVTLLSLREVSEGKDGQTRLTHDYSLTPFAKAVVYLVSWSFWNADGPVRLHDDQKKRLAQLRALDRESWEEIIAAIDKYEEEHEEAKKSPAATTETTSSSTSAAA